MHLYAEAVSDKEGSIIFNISSNDGAASSIGTCKNDWPDDIKMIKKITVQSINLMKFINEHKIDVIDDYISDAQGYGLLFKNP